MDNIEKVSEYCTIELTQNQIVRVSPEDWEWASMVKWFANKTIWGKFYARRKTKDKKEYLHRLIMKPKDGLDVDHINGDTLDCRRENMRCVTRSQNLMNVGKRKNNKSGYKGVVQDGPGRWYSQIIAGGKYHYLGYFTSPEDASRAYCEAAKDLHKGFTRAA